MSENSAGLLTGAAETHRAPPRKFEQVQTPLADVTRLRRHPAIHQSSPAGN